MAIIDNRVTQEGDILIIKPEVPRVGMLSLLNFTDQTGGETSSDYFKKFFRYSINGGIVFTEWLPLTQENVMKTDVKPTDTFVIELKYEKVGNTGEISFKNILLNGEYEKLKYPYYEKTPFSDFFPIKDTKVFGWALNVLEKLYQTGIVANYIDRGEGNSFREDEDFISFYNTITEFFAILVTYSRQFENLLTNLTLLREYLETKGLYLRSEMTLNDLVFLTENSQKEFRSRGTRRVIRKGSDNDLDGELLRLINYNEFDEFLFALTIRGEMGWNIGNSSPLYKGSTNIVNLNKSYEKQPNVYDLSKYPLINPPKVSIVEKDVPLINPIEMVSNGDFSRGLNNWGVLLGTRAEVVEDHGKTACKVTNLGYDLTYMFQDLLYNDGTWRVTFLARSDSPVNISIYREGIEEDFIALTDAWKSFSVDVPFDKSSNYLKPSFAGTSVSDFYITDISVQKLSSTLSVMQLSSGGGIGNVFDLDKLIPVDPDLDYEISFRLIDLDKANSLDFGVETFTKDKRELPNGIIRLNGLGRSTFFTQTSMKVKDQTYLVRGIIYGRNHPLDTDDKMSIGFGNNLKFQKQVAYILPVITNSTGTKQIYDLQIRPLELPCSRGTLGARNLTFMYAKNNSVRNLKEIEEIIDNELVPYNQFIKNKWL